MFCPSGVGLTFRVGPAAGNRAACSFSARLRILQAAKIPARCMGAKQGRHG
jgi:hypothetical protein